MNLLNNLTKSIKKDFFIYILLSYIDKLIYFLLPIGIAFLVPDKKIYNDLEYILSIAILLSIFLEGGLRIYIFYYFKENPDTASISKIQSYYDFHLTIVTLLLISVILYTYFLKINVYYFLFLISCRVLYLMFFNFYSYYYRIKDRPSKTFIISIPLNVIIIIILLLTYNHYVLDYFFIPQIILIVLYLTFRFKNYLKFNIHDYWNYLKSAFIYSWSIMINVLLLNLLNQFSKIYTYNYLSSSEMFSLSFILRIMMIIQLGSTSFIAYYSKDMYLVEDRKRLRKIFYNYVLLVLSANIIVIILYVGLDLIHFIKISDYGLLSILSVYMIFWSFQSFYDLFFGKNNKNFVALFISTLSSITMILILLLYPNINIYIVSLSMTIGIFINLCGKLFYLNKKNIIKYFI